MLSQQRLHQPIDENAGSGTIRERSADVVAPLKDSRFVLLRSRPSSPTSEQASPVTNASAEVTSGPQGGPPPPAIKNEHQKAFRLLEDVKGFIPQILRENDMLRQNLLELKSQAEAEIEAAEGRARDWKSSTDALKGQVETLEAMVLDLRGKLQRAESIVAIEKELSSKAGQEAAEAECLAKLFEDAVIQSFGVGTMFQDAFARVGSADR